MSLCLREARLLNKFFFGVLPLDFRWAFLLSFAFLSLFPLSRYLIQPPESVGSIGCITTRLHVLYESCCTLATVHMFFWPSSHCLIKPSRIWFGHTTRASIVTVLFHLRGVLHGDDVVAGDSVPLCCVLHVCRLSEIAAQWRYLSLACWN